LNLLLDSTYLFPAIGVEITEGWTNKDLQNLIMSEDYELYYCDLSLFEIYTKCMKLILQDKLNISVESLQNGIQGILNSTKLNRLNWWEHIYESDIVLKLKEIHNDSIDCMIFYVSMVNSDMFATFDDTFIDKIRENESILKLIQEINPQFKIWMKNLSQKPFQLGLKIKHRS
jgi:hypothetical protein